MSRDGSGELRPVKSLYVALRDVPAIVDALSAMVAELAAAKG
jgi:hypothetical protein